MLAKADMTDFAINEPVDLVLCLCDSLNYVTNPKKVLRTFKNVYQSLKETELLYLISPSLYKVNHTFLRL